MFYRFLFITLFLFPNIALSASCGNNSLSDYVILDGGIFVTFTVTDSQISTIATDSYIDIAITREINSSIIEDPNIRIRGGNLLGPELIEMTQGVEWLAVLNKSGESDYHFAGCAPLVKVENEIIAGQTGILELDESDDAITIEKFAFALNIYQQGINAADVVCRNLNAKCSETRATYDSETGILNLPTVLVSGERFINATLQITGDNPIIFNVIELNN